VTSTVEPRGNTGGADPADYTTVTGYDVLSRPTRVTSPEVRIVVVGQASYDGQPVAETGYDTWGSVTHTRDPRGEVTESSYDKLGRQIEIRYPTYTRPDLAGLGSYQDAVSDAAPVHYWHLDEPNGSGSAADSGSANSPGTYNGSPTLGHPSPVNGTSMLIPSWANRSMTHPILTDPTFSVEFLAFIDPISGTHPRIAVSNTKSDSNDGWNVRFIPSTDKLVLHMEGSTRITHPYIVTPGEWMHVAVTFDDVTNQAAMWVNGVKATGTNGTTFNFSPGVFKVGGQVSSTSQQYRWWKGGLDDVAFWDRTLTDAEVEEHYTAFRVGAMTMAPSETFVYDKVGNLVSRTSRRGQTTTFGFDDLNRVVQQTDPLVAGETEAGVSTTGYDDVGNVTVTVDQRGARRQFTYDKLNRVRTETDVVTSDPEPNEYTWEYGYDDLGNRVSTEDPTGAVAAAEFNAASEMIMSVDALTNETLYEYDLAGRVTKVTDPEGRGTVSVYDGAGRMTESRVVANDASPTLATTYGYDAAATRRASPRPVASSPPASSMTR
jgi:YD repeat-containing protein